jgi:xanthine/CO dehydrogenase XdhC/CoxF family maturation factor
MAAPSAASALILNARGTAVYTQSAGPKLLKEAREALETQASRWVGDFFFEYVAPPPAVFIFGAGDDAQPLVEFAARLGWHVTVADGRSQLARAERFPTAARVVELEPALQSAEPADAAVLMTHSYEQDRTVLRALLAREMTYIGVLGPRRRTERLVGEVASETGVAAEECMARLHTPVGLDLGGHSPAAIALAIAAELQAVFAGREARTLTQVGLIHA